jgi:hypothetical protein
MKTPTIQSRQRHQHIIMIKAKKGTRERDKERKSIFIYTVEAFISLAKLLLLLYTSSLLNFIEESD